MGADGFRRQWPQPHEPPQHPPPPPKLGVVAAPCAAKTDTCRRTFAAPQSGQLDASSPIRTSSSKCDSHSMQTYS